MPGTRSSTWAAALSILFTEESDQGELPVLTSRRAAWYFSDSETERQRTEGMLSEFEALHLSLMRGRPFEGSSGEDFDRHAELLTGADTVLRTSVQSLIVEGWPKDWHEATVASKPRFHPPRVESRSRR